MFAGNGGGFGFVAGLFACGPGFAVEGGGFTTGFGWALGLARVSRWVRATISTASGPKEDADAAQRSAIKCVRKEADLMMEISGREREIKIPVYDLVGQLQSRPKLRKNIF